MCIKYIIYFTLFSSIFLSPLTAFRVTQPSVSNTNLRGYNLSYNDENNQPGRVALVTGASRGIGKCIATTFAKSGIKHVICVAKSQSACDQVAAEIKKSGFSASGYGVDVSDYDAVKSLCDKLLEEHPNIDILVNNAGITKDNIFMRMTPEEWNQVINVNLNSAFYFTSPLIKRMIKNRFGRIINMASVVGVYGNMGQANYAASKAGLIGFTKTLAKEYANRNITANAIAPGFIQSQMTDNMTEEAKKYVLQHIPAGRQGKPEEIASLAAFLASDQAAYINGEVIEIDGGLII